MNTPSQGVHPWELVNMSFVASATTETLSFLAWGDNGETTNLPPTVFLAGVNSPSLIPEPSTWAMMIWASSVWPLSAAGSSLRSGLLQQLKLRLN